MTISIFKVVKDVILINLNPKRITCVKEKSNGHGEDYLTAG